MPPIQAFVLECCARFECVYLFTYLFVRMICCHLAAMTVCVCVCVCVCVAQCHTGILGGGHYVTYAKNPNNKWYCYNDSSCKVRPLSYLLCLCVPCRVQLYYVHKHCDWLSAAVTISSHVLYK